MNSAFTSKWYKGNIPEIPPKKKGMSGLQKFVIILFALTILTTIISLSLFYIEKPYLGMRSCPFEIHSFDNPELNTMNYNISECTMVREMTPPTPLLDAMININMGFGVGFIIAAIVLFFEKKRGDKNGC